MYDLSQYGRQSHCTIRHHTMLQVVSDLSLLSMMLMHTCQERLSRQICNGMLMIAD